MFSGHNELAPVKMWETQMCKDVVMVKFKINVLTSLAYGPMLETDNKDTCYTTGNLVIV